MVSKLVEVVSKVVEVVNKFVEVVGKLVEVGSKLVEVVSKLVEVVNKLVEVVSKLVGVVSKLVGPTITKSKGDLTTNVFLLPSIKSNRIRSLERDLHHLRPREYMVRYLIHWYLLPR